MRLPSPGGWVATALALLLLATAQAQSDSDLLLNFASTFRNAGATTVFDYWVPGSNPCNWTGIGCDSNGSITLL